MDEMLVGEWRSELEKALVDDVDRAYYRFITDFNEDGTPKHEFDGFRIHRRKNVYWSHPVHEVPRTYGKKEVTKRYNIEVWHKPDNSKIRSYYLPMLEMVPRALLWPNSPKHRTPSLPSDAKIMNDDDDEAGVSAVRPYCLSGPTSELDKARIN